MTTAFRELDFVVYFKIMWNMIVLKILILDSNQMEFRFAHNQN